MSYQTTLYYDVVDTPVGQLTILANDEGVLRVDYGSIEEHLAFYQNWTKKHLMKSSFKHQADHCIIQQTTRELREYFKQERDSFSVPLICYGTPFQKRVWRALLQLIPIGETRSYKDIAIALQAEKSVRAVGGAVNSNPFMILVPCHRVIGSNGKLVGYAGGLERKQKLLQHESKHELIKANM
ncbi:methylated-DNA--[protein]-cysteine S-methyltransferase [Halobacillus sp. Marseille-Q1614]|uniref:methylated-DNA--[protein]-cysteine S-methyltransferase n=1 Tax=Halobacillus sp. Marseille-Q1614 TaxID=2709134 RepID=UPI00156FD756|nr:methylated-DNA--[protein]-cysteine S-methyltransferase [Halobacillus sp. Marseille-Q1614]